MVTVFHTDLLLCMQFWKVWHGRIDHVYLAFSAFHEHKQGIIFYTHLFMPWVCATIAFDWILWSVYRVSFPLIVFCSKLSHFYDDQQMVSVFWGTSRNSYIIIYTIWVFNICKRDYFSIQENKYRYLMQLVQLNEWLSILLMVVEAKYRNDMYMYFNCIYKHYRIVQI